MKVAIQAVILIACLLAFMALSYLLRRLLSRTVKKEWFFYLLLAPGTIIHELCHLIASLITFTPVHEVHLFRLRQEPDGTVHLGEVVHADVGPIRNFIIAVAPLFGTSVLIFFLSAWLLPRESWMALLTSGWTYLFLVLVFFIALGLSPSQTDLKALPMFLIVASVLGVVTYFVVRWVGHRYDLSEVTEAATSTLRTANTGLFFVLVAVGVAVALFSTVWAVSKWLRKSGV